ncbi:MAG: biotin--[acetyl-CoA-carboxylase] ligase, partial [Flavobacteriaceae bacterium]
GKGRQSNSWSTVAGKGLAFTLILDKEYSNSFSSFISLAAGISIVESIMKRGVDCLLKWPNDVFASNKKIGGILIENTLSSNQVDYSIIGMGINVNQTQFEDLPRASSLRLLMGQSFDVSTLFQSCLEALHSFFFHVKSLQKETILEAYNRHLFGKDRWLNIELNQTSITAKMVEVTADGHPIVLDQEGTLTNLKGKIVRFHWD